MYVLYIVYFCTECVCVCVCVHACVHVDGGGVGGGGIFADSTVYVFCVH